MLSVRHDFFREDTSVNHAKTGISITVSAFKSINIDRAWFLAARCLHGTNRRLFSPPAEFSV